MKKLYRVRDGKLHEIGVVKVTPKTFIVERGWGTAWKVRIWRDQIGQAVNTSRPRPKPSSSGARKLHP